MLWISILFLVFFEIHTSIYFCVTFMFIMYQSFSFYVKRFGLESKLCYIKVKIIITICA